MACKHKVKVLGQVFTPRFVADFMVSLVSKPKSSLVLEPCAGTGVFLSALYEAGFRNIHAFEIDRSLPNYSPVRISYRDFLGVKPVERYDVVVGNPPYVRWKNIPLVWRRRFRCERYWWSVINGLCDLTYAFIYHVVNMMKPGGELVFITPVFWTEAIHGRKLREFLAERGGLELLVMLNEMRVFEGVSSSIIIFKYVKGCPPPSVKVIVVQDRGRLTSSHLVKIKELINRLEEGEEYIREDIYTAFLHDQFQTGEPWRPVPKPAFSSNPLLSLSSVSAPATGKVSLLGEIAEVGNGMVSGLDKAFRLSRNDLGSLNMVEKKHIIYVFKARCLDRFFPVEEPVPYVYVNDVENEDELRKQYPFFYRKLIRFKDRLSRRYSYGKNIPWWHWVFPRNKHLFEKYEEKILVPSKERYDTRGYFRFAYIKGLYYVTQDVTVICPKPKFREGIKYLLALLNSESYQQYIIYKGFTRGGVYDFSENPLASIPIIRIDWNSREEVKLYEEITGLVDEIISRRVWLKYMDVVNELVYKLMVFKRFS